MIEQSTMSPREEAILWHIRMQDPAFDAWGDFTDWLGHHPDNNAAYEAVADTDLEMAEDLEALPKPVIAANDDADEPWTAPVQRRWKLPVAAAAAALLAVTGYQFAGLGNSEYLVQTAAGEVRTIALGDGDRIILNGDTRVKLDKDNPRFASLESGEARFDITHDASKPFTVEMGDQKVVDVGTVFNIVRDAKAVEVEVAHGEVRYEGYGRTEALKAGSTLSAGQYGRIAKGRKPVDAIGSWQRGELVYEGAALGEVAQDLGRATGIRIVVSPGAAERPFSGVIQTKGDKAQLRRRVETLLGVNVQETANGWTLAP